jgi:excisionase family DNA binding protein
MPVSFLTSFTEEEFKNFLKQAITEVLVDQNISQQATVPEILDIRQAADFLKLKITTLYEKTSQKTIPHFKKGNKLYFNRVALIEWLNSGRVKTSKEIESEALSYLMSRKKDRLP